MADITKLPLTFNFFQWPRESAANPRLKYPISDTDTTIVVTDPPLDDSDAVITGSFLMGIEDETVWVPAGAVSVDGLTFTGCVRGIHLSGIDHTAGHAALAYAHNEGTPVSCNISAIIFSELKAAVQGIVGTGANAILVGDLTGADVSFTAQNDQTIKPRMYYDESAQRMRFHQGDDGPSTGLDLEFPIIKGTTAQLAALPELPAGGMVAYDTTLGKTVFREGSAWVQNAAGGTVADASETVAGKVELATNAEMRAGTSTGGTGARLVPPNDQLVATSAGAADQGKLSTLDANGDYDKTTMPIPLDGFVNGTYTLGETVAAGDVVGYRGGSSEITCNLVSSGGGSASNVYGANWVGQTIVIPSNMNRVIGAYMNFDSKTGAPPGNLNISIYATTAGVPSGASLGTVSVTADSISSGTSCFLVKFTSEIVVTASGTYALVWSVPSGDAGKYLVSRYDATSVTGNRVYSSNSGASWTADAASDYRFGVIYGRSNDGGVYKMAGNDITRLNGIVGIMAEGGNLLDNKLVYHTFALTSGLTQGSTYYVSDTAGTIASTPGTYMAKVGRATDTTHLTVRPRMTYTTGVIAVPTYLIDLTTSTKLFAPLPFKPDYFILRASSLYATSSTKGEGFYGTTGTASYYTLVVSNAAAAGTTGTSTIATGGLYIYNTALTDYVRFGDATITDYGIWFDYTLGGTPGEVSFTVEAHKY